MAVHVLPAVRLSFHPTQSGATARTLPAMLAGVLQSAGGSIHGAGPTGRPMSDKHTPTPWRVLHSGYPHVVVVTEKWDSEDGVLICYPGRHTSAADPEVQANAEFIVRACNSHEELLAAARSASLELTTVGIGHGHTHSQDVVARLQAAIAKAEGR